MSEMSKYYYIIKSISKTHVKNFENYEYNTN